MPGPALHHMIAERLRMRIGASNGLGPTLSASEYAQLDTLLADPANLPYLYLGCQGPDFLFFNTNDVSPTLKDLVEAYYDVYDFIENFKRDLIKAVPQPVLDALAAFDEAANAVVTSSSTLTELQETLRGPAAGRRRSPGNAARGGQVVGLRVQPLQHRRAPVSGRRARRAQAARPSP